MDSTQQFLGAYDAYADAIFRHCVVRVSSRALAEDMTQEVFLKVWTYVSEGNTVGNMRAFLYKVANNVIIDHSRRKKEERLDALLEEKRIPEPSYAGHRDIELNIMLHEVKELMKELPPDEERLIVMRYLDDLDPKDIAEVLGITANSASVRLHRAITHLKTRAKFHESQSLS